MTNYRVNVDCPDCSHRFIFILWENELDEMPMLSRINNCPNCMGSNLNIKKTDLWIKYMKGDPQYYEHPYHSEEERPKEVNG